MKQLVGRMKMGRTNNGFVLGGFLVSPSAANAPIGLKRVGDS